MSQQSDFEFVGPEAAEAKQQAAELFVHGVLAQMQRDTPLEKERRIQRVMESLMAEKSSARHWHFSRLTRIGLAAAAALALFVSMIYVGISTEKSADATVADSIAAMRSSGDRRFEVRAKLETEKDLGKEPMATIDTRAPNLMLLKSKGLDNRGLTVGRDAEGVWAIERDGTVERENPEIRWPRWAMLGDESLFADSIDQLLETMSQSYDIKNSEATALSGRGDIKFSHLTGRKKSMMQPGPVQIDLWLDPESKIVERMEMRFERPPQNQAGGPPPGGSKGPDRGRREPSPDGGRPPRDRIDRAGPPPDGRAGGPRAGELHESLPDGMRDGRPNGPLPDGKFGKPRGPMRGPLGRPDPLRGPRGERLPPLELLVIDRVPPPVFTEGYFDAKSHAAP